MEYGIPPPIVIFGRKWAIILAERCAFPSLVIVGADLRCEQVRILGAHPASPIPTRQYGMAWLWTYSIRNYNLHAGSGKPLVVVH